MRQALMYAWGVDIITDGAIVLTYCSSFQFCPLFKTRIGNDLPRNKGRDIVPWTQTPCCVAETLRIHWGRTRAFFNLSFGAKICRRVRNQESYRELKFLLVNFVPPRALSLVWAEDVGAHMHKKIIFQRWILHMCVKWESIAAWYEYTPFS